MMRLVPMRSRQPAHGFSLVELLVVLAVLGVLSMLVMPLAELSTQRERERDLRKALWDIRTAIDDYKRAVDAGAVAGVSGGSGYPPSLEALVKGVPATVQGKTIYLLRRIPRDPFADPALPDEATWALRSFQSPPDRPRPGADVYDVSSRSELIGLNGVPLKEW